MRRPTLMTRTTLGLMAACVTLAAFAMDTRTCHAQINFVVNLETSPAPFTDGFAYWYGESDDGVYSVSMRVKLTKKTIVNPSPPEINLRNVKFVVRKGKNGKGKGKSIFSRANLDGQVKGGVLTLWPRNFSDQIVVQGNVSNPYTAVPPDPNKNGPGTVDGTAFVSK